MGLLVWVFQPGLWLYYVKKKKKKKHISTCFKHMASCACSLSNTHFKRKMSTLKGAKCTQSHTQTHKQINRHRYKHLAIRSFSQNSKKLKAVRSNSLTVSVDTFTGQLHLLGLNTGTGREVIALVKMCSYTISASFSF